MNNALHYNIITKSWLYLMGENFHWGYFKKDSDTLETATNALINKMLENLKLSTKTKILDIGCGTGNVSNFLHEKFGCEVSGFSNSEEGINYANHKFSSNENLQFFVRDATDNKFKEKHFDLTWCMEMSHLIEDKKKLINENYRVLKDGGLHVLCDLMLQRPLTVREIHYNKKNLETMQRAFGLARLETYEYYNNLFIEIGFKDVEFIDIAKNVIPTLLNWKNNAKTYKKEILAFISEDNLNDFVKSCDYLEEFYNKKIWGYGIIIGKK